MTIEARAHVAGPRRHLLLAVAAIAFAASGCTPKSTDKPEPARADAVQQQPTGTGAPAAELASTAPDSVPGAGCRIPTASLIAQLRAQEFAKIEAALADLHAKVGKQTCSDRWLLAALTAFSNTEPALGASIERWVEQEPRSAYARAARGEHRYSVAMHQRGGRFSSRTPKSQLDAMNRAFEGASEDLRDAIALDETLLPAHARLMSIAAAGGGPLQERAVFERAIAIAPHSFALRWTTLQRLQPKWGGSLEAIDAFLADTRAFEPRDPELRALRGFRQFAEADVLLSADRDAEAVERFNAALAISDLPWSRLRRARALLNLGRHEEAERAFRTLVAREEYLADAWYHLGRIAEKLGRREQALEFFGRSLAYDGGDPDVLRSTAWLAWVLGQHDAALAHLATATRVTPDRADVHALLGELLYLGKRNAEAAAALERATTLDPSNSQAWRYRGLTLLRLKDRQNAITAFGWAISKSPKDAQLRYERGFAYQRLFRDDDKALGDFREAARLSPQSTTYQYSLASTAYRAHDCDVVPAARAYVALCDAGRCRSDSPEKAAWARRVAANPSYATRCPTEYAAVAGVKHAR